MVKALEAAVAEAAASTVSSGDIRRIAAFVATMELHDCRRHRHCRRRYHCRAAAVIATAAAAAVNVATRTPQ